MPRTDRSRQGRGGRPRGAAETRGLYGRGGGRGRGREGDVLGELTQPPTYHTSTTMMGSGASTSTQYLRVCVCVRARAQAQR